MSSSFARALAGALVLVTSEARADHDDPAGPQLTDDTAYTVPEGQLKVGLLTVEYGLVDGLQLGTIPLFDLALFPNALVEWRFAEEPWGAVSVTGGLAYLHTRLVAAFVDDFPLADIFVAPVDLVGTFVVHDDWSISVGSAFTGTYLSGTFDDDDFAGAAAVSNLQFHGTVEWRMSSLVAMQLHARYLAFQSTGAAAEVEFMPDDFTNVRAAAVAESDLLDFPHAFLVTPRFHFSWRKFNLAAGVGYGNPIIPFVNFVLPTRRLVPELDLYWRW